MSRLNDPFICVYQILRYVLPAVFCVLYTVAFTCSFEAYFCGCLIRVAFMFCLLSSLWPTFHEKKKLLFLWSAFVLLLVLYVWLTPARIIFNKLKMRAFLYQSSYFDVKIVLYVWLVIRPSIFNKLKMRAFLYLCYMCRLLSAHPFLIN